MSLFNRLVLIITMIFLISTLGFSRGKPDWDKPKKILEYALKNTATCDGYKIKMTSAKNNITWEGIYSSTKGFMLLGIVDKLLVYFDGKNFWAEREDDIWTKYSNRDFKNFGAANMKSKTIKNPVQMLGLIKKYSSDVVKYTKDVQKDEKAPEEKKETPKIKNPNIKIIEASEIYKKPPSFIDYKSAWKKIKKDEHWADSTVSGSKCESVLTVGKEDMLIYRAKFKYSVDISCNYSSGDSKCLGCIEEIGDEITMDFSYPDELKIDLPKSLMKKLGIKEDLSVEGLLLELSVSNQKIRKGQSFEFTVKWTNVSRKDIIIARRLRTNPYLGFQIEGDLKFDSNRSGTSSLQDTKEIILKPGKSIKAVVSVESDQTMHDDVSEFGFTTGKYFVTAVSKLQSGTLVQSNTISINIQP